VCGKPYRGFESHSLRQCITIRYCNYYDISISPLGSPQIGPQTALIPVPVKRHAMPWRGPPPENIFIWRIETRFTDELWRTQAVERSGELFNGPNRDALQFLRRDLTCSSGHGENQN
jgi:hypothetical protein